MTTDPMNPVPPEPSQVPPPATGAVVETNKDAKMMAMLSHLLGIFTGFIGALIIWLVKKEVPFVERQAKEALNFQITMFIASVGLGIITCGFGAPVVWVVNVIFCIMGAMKANEGIEYRYPFALRLIK